MPDSIMRYFLALCLFQCAFLLPAQEGKEPILVSEGKTYGQVVGIEAGDYFYLLFKDAAGETEPFLVLRPDDKLETVLNDIGNHEGRAAAVKWRETVRYVPEAGSNIRQKEAYSIELTTPE